jgi:tRNA threonylcarbamoyladenosine biosynthesis protein TsaE
LEIININNEKETKEYGLKLAKTLKPGDVVALIGDLGTGKTTLTKYIAEGLGVKENVNSPTFTIVKEYRSGRMPLFHFDVYRIKNEEEM